MHVLSSNKMLCSRVIREQKLVYCVLFILTISFAIITPAAYGNTVVGKILFLEHCAECHGEKGDGQGAVGVYLEGQRPANLLGENTRARSNDALFEIIQYGVHLEMPSWEGVLKDQEILSIVDYLRVLAPSFPQEPN